MTTVSPLNVANMTKAAAVSAAHCSLQRAEKALQNQTQTSGARALAAQTQTYRRVGARSSLSLSQLSRHNTSLPQLAGGCVTTGRGTLPVLLRYSVSLVTNHTPDLGLVPATAAAACHPAPALLRLSSTLCLGGGRRVGRVRCHCSVYRLSRPARHTAQRQLHTFCNYITLYEVPDTTFGQRGNCV